MIRAKNYETVSKIVKVMPRILWPLFFPDTVYTVGVTYWATDAFCSVIDTVDRSVAAVMLNAAVVRVRPRLIVRLYKSFTSRRQLQQRNKMPRSFGLVNLCSPYSQVRKPSQNIPVNSRSRDYKS